MSYEEERKALDEQRRKLEREKLEFSRKVEIEDRRLEQQQQLFDMKFKILEEELAKLASEKETFERKKSFYSHVNSYEQDSYEETSYEQPNNIINGEIFFSGVGSRASLRKRYRDLIKIYHPDNVNGDSDTVQEINREYDHLSKVFC